MSMLRGPFRGRPVIAHGVRLLRVTRTGLRAVEVIADVSYRESSRRPLQSTSVLARVTLPPECLLVDLRRTVLEEIFAELGRSRRAAMAVRAR